jgi:hypothetical protein
VGSADRSSLSAPIGLVVDTAAAEAAHREGEDAWWLYSTEVLDHLRLPYDVLAAEALTDLGGTPSDAPGVLVFSRPPTLGVDAVTAVTAFVERGGGVVLCGGPGTLADLAGVTAASPVTDGHVRFVKDALTQPPDVPVHAYGGVELVSTGHDDDTDGRVLASWGSGAAAIVTRQVGNGVVVVCGPDLWQSIVRIQQGFRVEEDGRPAADGSCPVDDGILKCDDGLPLGYDEDRALPPGEAGVQEGLFPHEFPPPAAAPIFHRPHADIWRRVFFTLVLDVAARCDVVLPWLFYWPAGIPAVAHMSHDSDGNVSEYAATALEVFDEIDVRVTWCHVYPGGYDPAIVAAIADRGHEQALHYNAMEDADIASWGWPQLRAQYAWAQALTGRERIVSNKNHYTRWEGWHEFFTWCERIGIEIDQSRGPSKQGDVGFPFGSCHLWFPIADAAEANRRIDVLELPLHTQDLAWAGHEANRDVILDQVLAEHGVAHFLFHSPHLHLRPPTRAACVRLAAEARARGMQWWTSEQLTSWERRRRGVRVDVVREGGDGTLRVSVAAADSMAGAAILLAVPGLSERTTYAVEAGHGTTSVVTRHGRAFLELATDLPAGPTTFTVRPCP